MHACVRRSRSPLILLASSSPNQPPPPDPAANQIGIAPDHVFGLQLGNGSRRWFMVEIDRGTMPVSRSDFRQTSIERKLRAYLAAHAARQHQRRFGWNTFRVLTVTNDARRMRSILDTLQKLRVARSTGAQLFLFAMRADVRAAGPLVHLWRDGDGYGARLIWPSETGPLSTSVYSPARR